MIAIVNISEDLRPVGLHKYQVRINRNIIAEFTHHREEGLSTCLRKAADAVDWARIHQLLEVIDGNKKSDSFFG